MDFNTMQPRSHRPSSFGDTASNVWGSEILFAVFVRTWPLTSDSYTSSTWTAE